MISSQVLQNAIDELRSITRIDLCVFDPEGRTVVSTFNGEDISKDMVCLFNDSAADSQVIQGYHFFKIFDDQVVEYILVARGSSEDTYMIGKVAVSEIQNLIVAYKERFDKNNFIQNLLLDNLLLVDIYNWAKKLHIGGGSTPGCLHDRDQTGERSECQRASENTVCHPHQRFYHRCG